ncbi:hypothetical protein ANN_22278 [Periplaneta americana]|uniref:Uncharacterized protein n=1 Tax=Periplaneta americana TaxID=6978 RepID=A0ABQ8S864_PERAM|nr:hypothetical protein ANN_22278 [Periplaneta americana]
MAGLCEGGNEPASSLKAICKQARKIVFKVYNYFKNVDEQNAAGHLDAGCNVANAQETTAEACGVGLRTVQRILLVKERVQKRQISDSNISERLTALQLKEQVGKSSSSYAYEAIPTTFLCTGFRVSPVVPVLQDNFSIVGPSDLCPRKICELNPQPRMEDQLFMTPFDGSLATSLFGKVRGLLFDVVGRKRVEWNGGGQCTDLALHWIPRLSKSAITNSWIQDLWWIFAGNIATLTRSPQKSTRQNCRESGLTRNSNRDVLKNELNFRPWKPHYCQDLSAENCDQCMEYGDMLGLYED